jgi:FG-GAP-like repeat
MVGRKLIQIGAVVTVLAAGAVGTAHPVSAVSGIHFTFSPSPIALPHSLTGGQAVPVTLTALNGNGTPAASENVNLSLQHQDPGNSGGAATVGATTLTNLGQPFTTDGSGHIAINYTAPAVQKTTGRDVLVAADVTTPGITAFDVYDSSTVTGHNLSPSPIAPASSLAAGSTVSVTLTASPTTVAADVYLSFVGPAPGAGGGSAKVGTTPLTSSFTRFTTDGTGHLTITFTAPSSGAGTDTINSENYTAFSKVTASTSYTYAFQASCASSRVPVAGAFAGGAPAFVGLAAVGPSGTCVMAGGATGLQPPSLWQSAPFSGSITTLAGDVTGDGTTDLVALNSSSTSVETSTGSAFNPPATWSHVPFFGSRANLLVDLTGNGKADLVAVNDTSTWVMLSTGTGFSAPTKWSGAAFFGSKATLAASVSGSGRADLVAVNATTTWVMRSTGTSFSGPVEWSGQAFYGSQATLVADVSGDGKADLVAVNNGTTWVMVSTGSGFASPTLWSSAPFFGNLTTLAGDLNGDGKSDLIAVNTNSVWAMLSTGSAFGGPQSWASTSI